VHQIELEMQNEELRRTQLSLEESRSKYLDLYEFAPVGYFTLTDKGLIAAVNLTGAGLLGGARQKLLNGRFRRFVAPEDQGAWDHHLLSVLKGEEKQSCDLHLRRVDGSTLPAHLESIRVRTGDSAPLVNALVSDITDRWRAEKVIAAQNKELDAFNYSISHDLRAPLRIIDIFARMLQKELAESTNSEIQHKIEVIRKHAARMNLLIVDLLAFSRLERRELAAARVDMGGLVRDALEEVGEADQERKVTFHIGTLPPCFGDRILLKQVWLNLLTNALKFTKFKEMADIQVGGYRDGDSGVFFVRDNGTGFDMQYKDKLFMVFQRLPTAEKFEGTGIGLAIVEKIILRHGGKVWAEGEENKGATFYFSIPALPPEEQR